MKGAIVSDLLAIARQRSVLAAIADAIEAASVGKGLRVVIICPSSHLALVDHLAQALHARGRACQCLPPELTPRDAGGVPADREETGSAIVEITSGQVMAPDLGVQRVNISVTAAAPAARHGGVSQREQSTAYSATGGVPDIILDYDGPGGLTIRHMAPHLSVRDQQ